MARYFFGLVDKDGAIVARSESVLHAHGEGSRVLDKHEPGVGRKGETVRVPSPLEDPTAHDGDAGDGVRLALLADLDAGDGDGTQTVVCRYLDGAAAPAAADADLLDSRLSEIDRRLAELDKRLAAQPAV